MRQPGPGWLGYLSGENMGGNSAGTRTNGFHSTAKLGMSPDGTLEQLAKEQGVSTIDVVRNLLPDHRTIVAGGHLPQIMRDVSSWGEILLVVHTPDVVLEWPTAIPTGTASDGYFRFPGDSSIGGNIRWENCLHIAFICRPFLNRASRSIQFFNSHGDVMFKIFVMRDGQRNLISEQVEKFEALRTRCASRQPPPVQGIEDEGMPHGDAA